MNQKRHKAKRALRIRLAILYTLMVVAVVLLVGGLYLVIQGYRYNRAEGRLQQGGLVQFNSQPSGASVWLDGNLLGVKTQNKLTISAGTHKFSMWKDGYNDWNVERQVQPGTVLWLNYVRLVPKDLKVAQVENFKAITSSVVSYDNKSLALVEDAAQPLVTVVGLDTESPVKDAVTLPEGAYTAAESHDFTVVAWAYDNKFVLVKHVFDGKTEWISVNTANKSEVKNVSVSLGVDAVDVQFSRNDANTFYLLTANGEVRRANIDQRSLSGPLLREVDNFSLYAGSTIAYATKPDANGVRSVGYLTADAKAPRVVEHFNDAVDIPLRIVINKYYGRHYFVVAKGKDVTILTSELPASDTADPALFKKLTSLTLEDTVKWVGFSPDDHRFVYAQGENGLMVYDLDMSQAFHPVIAGATEPIEWVDQFHFTAATRGELKIYDFDGTNSHVMMDRAASGTSSLLSNGKYLYGLQRDAANGTVHLSRATMTVE